MFVLKALHNREEVRLPLSNEHGRENDVGQLVVH